MTLPFQYDHGDPLMFGGEDTDRSSFDQARAVILPVPLDRTASWVAGTRHGPAEILQASAHMELWDEELGVDVSDVGICTLPEMELPFGDIGSAVAEIQRVAAAILERDKFLVILGGEHSVTPPVVAAAAARHADLCVLQIDAHSDLRESFMGSPWSHACAMRRALEHARCTQVGIRSMSGEEADIVDSLNTTIFRDVDLRQRKDWIADVVASLGPRVYITIDCDGLDPAIMPAVGTPEPGGLSWRETLTLLRATFHAHQVVGCDVVELCPIPGLVHPNFLCAKLVYKLLTYKFADLG